MTAPDEPRDELTPAQQAEVDRLYADFHAPDALRHAIAEGRARAAGYEPLLPVDDAGTQPCAD